ncbi:UNVERIFIED_CONTAM: hypothetical protein Slati_2257200 [Sesamum latifolium]|uniref:Uncharacterized protein n=1 Tax=Sesamum latifolium TaxID=2727402 RepID=A0AAW2WUR5_9LAMI
MNARIAGRLCALRGAPPRADAAPAASEVDTSATPDLGSLPALPAIPVPIEVANGDTHTHCQASEPHKNLSACVEMVRPRQVLLWSQTTWGLAIPKNTKGNISLKAGNLILPS